MRRTRRWAPTLAGVLAGLLVVTACGGDDGDDDGGGGGSEVEVFSWWTGPGESAGLEAMVADFEENNPDIAFRNEAVAGGAGSNAKAVLQSRLQANNPPDSFQGHAGAELLDYITQDQLEPLDSLYDEQGWREVFPEQLLDQITHEGHIYSVPVNIHRANVLWYNPTVLQDAGISEPPTTLDGFFAALEQIRSSSGGDIIPISMGEQWTVQHAFETILLANLGTEGYAALWEPGADWSSPEVTKAISDFERLLSYVNTDAPSLTWQDAAKLVADGEAAFNIMGDWVAGYYTSDLQLEPETGFGWAAVPGTDGVYQWLSDSFTLPKGAPHPDAAMEWLKECGSREGQDLFNPKKGSIPVRTDADTSLYEGYLAWALEEWKKDELAGSLAHGVVASQAWMNATAQAAGQFFQSKDTGAFHQALTQAYDQYGQSA